MDILRILLICLLALAALYLLMIMPRMAGRPDTAPFKKWLYAHRGLHDNRGWTAGGAAQNGQGRIRDAAGVAGSAADGAEGAADSAEGAADEAEGAADSADEMAPENSMRAFQRAVDAGYGIEMDVQMTKDHIPVVFHDFTLNRICGAEGKLCDYTWSELQRFTLCGSDQRIPKFEDVLKCVDGRVPLIVELKIEETDLSVCPAVDGLLSEYGGMYCIESFNPLGLLWYRRHRGGVVRGQLSEAFRGKKGDKGILLYLALRNLLFNWLTKPDFVAYNHKHQYVLSRRLCRGLYRNMAVAWTIRSQEQLEEAKKSFDLFIFDSFIPAE